ncbi:MAG: hypothetical protein ACHQQ3_01735 [Gemmatimonadales bacterium]
MTDARGPTTEHQFPVTKAAPVLRAVTLAASAVLLLGLRFAWLGQKQAEWFQEHLGYYVVLALVILSLVFFAQVSTTRGWRTWAYWREHRNALLLVAAGTVFLHRHEPHMLRVFFDEPTHALAALSMHLDKSAVGATVSNYVGETFVTGETYAVARPYLFPLLVSILHDVTGYRVANVFVLNVLLTPLPLLGAYLLACKLGGRLAGYVAIVLLVTFPLLAQNVTSGGYDVLNMALVAAWMLATLAYFTSGEDSRGPLMNLSLAIALLLAATRAESVLYLVPWGAVTLACWRRERRVQLTTFAAFSPVFLLPAFMSNLHMMHNDAAMVAELRTRGEAFFDVANLPKHLSEAVYYFFHFDLDSTNSVLLAALGATGLVGLLVQVAGSVRARRAKHTEALLALFAVSVAAVYLFVLTLFWSSPLDPLAARFCLALSLVWAVTAGWLVTQVPWLKERPRVVIGALLLWGGLVAAPAMSRAYATHEMTPAWTERYFLEVAASRDRRETLYAMQSNASFIVNKFASTLLVRVGAFPAVHVRAIKAGLYREVLILQTLEPVGLGRWLPRQGQGLPVNIVLETVAERSFGPGALARVSRLVGYKKADGTLVTPASDDPDVRLKQEFENYEAWKRYRLSLYP